MKIGIIGGSGFEKEFLDKKIGNHEIFFVSRHGENHERSPTKVNYDGNIRYLKNLGVDLIIATSACGSLKEELKPGSIVLPDQFIDWTTKRDNTISFDHTPMAEPFDFRTRDLLFEIGTILGFEISKDKTILTIEGNRFSTKAESRMFRQFADVINMTTCPEVIFANELHIPYQVICMVTDYDSWDENKEPVTWDIIKKRMEENSEKVKELIIKFLENLQ